jgi:hypothetical protein
VHLYIAGPAGLAFMLGQLSNTLGDVHLYEHQQSDATGVYLLAAAIGCK